MNKNFNLKSHSHRRLVLPFTFFSIFIIVFFTTFISSSILAPIDSGNAETVRVELGNDYYVETSSEDLNLSLSATPDGALAVAKGTVNTKTNCNGYKLYLSSAATNPTTPIMNPTTGQVEDVATNSMILDGSDSTQGDWLPVTAGKFNSADGGPQAFKDATNTNTNTWGFAVPSGSTGLPATAGAFDASYGTTEAGTADPTNKFASVPLYSSPVLIQETNTPNETGVDLDVYYGVYANMNKTEGDYTGSALYTVTAESPNVSASVAPTTITNFGGTSLTITTPLFTSMPLSAIDATVAVGGQSCPVTAISTVDGNNEPSTLAITCTAPSLNVGTYSVVASVPKFAQSWTLTNAVTYSLGGTAITAVSPNTMETGDASSITGGNLTITTNATATGLTASDIDFKLGNTSIPVSSLTTNPLTLTIDATASATKTALESLSSGTYSAYLTAKGQTISMTDAFTVESSLPSFYTITTMQEMTPEVCNSVYTPGKQYISYGGTTPNIVTKAQAEAGGYTATDNGQNFIPETTLIDYRGKDGTGTAANPVTSGSNVKTYTVRKLADGNCWMTESLYLPLANNVGVEASYNNGSTFTYTPTSCSGDSECGINQNTQPNSTYGTYYYNWFAATAGKGTSSTAANVDVDGSICPKGWKLPSNYTVTGTNPTTGTAWKDMSWPALTLAYLNITTNTSTSTGYQTLVASPISLLRAGYYSNGSFYSGGSYGSFGDYWSSTANSTSNAYNLVFHNGYVGPQYNYNKASYGLNVRCLAVR